MYDASGGVASRAHPHVPAAAPSAKPAMARPIRPIRVINSYFRAGGKAGNTLASGVTGVGSDGTRFRRVRFSGPVIHWRSRRTSNWSAEADPTHSVVGPLRHLTPTSLRLKVNGDFDLAPLAEQGQWRGATAAG